MKPRETQTTRTVYLQNCAVCGKDFSVSKDSEETTCYDCQSKAAVEKAQKELEFLLGAEIVNLKLKDRGSFTGSDEISSIGVRTKGGRLILLEADGWDERYISWEEE